MLRYVMLHRSFRKFKFLPYTDISRENRVTRALFSTSFYPQPMSPISVPCKRQGKWLQILSHDRPKSSLAEALTYLSPGPRWSLEVKSEDVIRAQDETRKMKRQREMDLKEEDTDGRRGRERERIEEE